MANKNFAGKAPEIPVKVESAKPRTTSANCVHAYSSPMDFGGGSGGGDDAESRAFDRELQRHRGDDQN